MSAEFPTWLMIAGGVVAFVAFGFFLDFFFPFDTHEEERDPAAGLKKKNVHTNLR